MTSSGLAHGQAMVEYLVVLAALIAALLLSGIGSVGLTQDDKGSLLKAVADKHRGQGYGLSLSEIPETDDLVKLSLYYDSLGKYPELSKQLKSGGGSLNTFTNVLNEVNKEMGNFNIDWKDPFKGINLKPDFGVLK
jgi:hypothetical protein